MGHLSKEEKLARDAFLKENCNLIWDDMAIKYNKQFNTNFNGHTLRIYATRNNIYHNDYIFTDRRISANASRKITNGHISKHYSQEQVQWLKDSITKYSYEDLRIEFNKVFNENIAGCRTLKSYCNNVLKLKNNRPYSALSEHNINKHNIGDILSENGVEYIKIYDTGGQAKNNHSLNGSSNWKKRVIYEYEKLYTDKVDTKLETVIQLNGNRLDYSKSNLCKIKKTLIGPLCASGCLGLGEYGITQAYVECLETERFIKDIEVNG